MTAPKKNSVVFIGRTVIDEYYETDHFPAEGEKVHLTPVQTVPGGFSNSAFVLASLGTECFLAETLGDDAYTALHEKLMEEAGIDTTFVRVRPGAKNNTAIILRTTGSSEKTVFTFRTDPHPVPYTPAELSAMAGAGWVFANMNDLKKQDDPEGFTKALLAGGARLAIDGEPSTFTDPQTEDFFFSRCSFLSLNDFAYEKFCRDDPLAVEHFLSRNPACTVVYTMGAEGCTVFTADRKIFCPSCRVQAADTTGAGDTFNAAYLHKLIAGASHEECARFACAAAARSTLFKEPRAGAVSEAEVEQFISDRSYDPHFTISPL